MASTEEPTSTAEVTTATEASSTTFSEDEMAEVEIREVVTGWWQLEYDTSTNNDVVLEALTGPQLQQSTEYNASLAGRGVVRRNPGLAPIEITGVTIDMVGGMAEVDACAELTHEFLDAETGDVLEDIDPDGAFESLFQLQIVDEVWKISGWFPSTTDGSGAVACEIGT